MRTILRNPWLVVGALCWTLLADTWSAAGVLWAQEAPPGYVEWQDEEFTEVRPTTCPQYLRGGLIGWLVGFPHAGHSWTASWDRREVLSPDYDLALYTPHEYDGYSSPRGDYIEAYYSDARWYEPQIKVKCTATSRYFRGRLIASSETYRTVQTFGTVVECSNSGGSGSGQLIDDNGYDIYDPDYSGYSGSSCNENTGGDGGSGDGSGSGTQYGPGDSTGGETVDWGTGTGNGGSSACGAKAVVEYICIDLYYPGIGWVEWGCGFVTTC